MRSFAKSFFESDEKNKDVLLETLKTVQGLLPKEPFAKPAHPPHAIKNEHIIATSSGHGYYKGEVFTVRYYDKETGYEVDEHPDRFTGQQSSTSLYRSLLNYRDSTYPRPSSWEENRFDPADFVILSEAGEKLGLYARTLKEALRTPMDELQVSISEYYPTTTLGSFSSETKFKALLREYEPVVMSYYETIKPIINDWETGLRECFAEEYTKPFTADPFLFLRDYYQRATDSIFFQYRDCFSEESDAGILSGFHPIKKERMSVELPKTIRTVYKSLIDTVLDKLVEQYASDVAEVIFSDPVTYLFALEKENK